MDGGDKYIGRILDNRYEILELIGTGGMALVYKARCHRLNRMVAIKILKEDLAEDDDFRRRFHTESQAVGMLSHPNIVAVYDVSRSGNTEYIVMELIEGITLKQYINRKGLLNWKEALHFSSQVTKALSHAHSRGIIHRDIKPHNIMILKDGSVKVADFGIARLLTMQNTLTQEALGSVHYISPEQAKGGHVDARSDIYSLGVVMYEMLTSRLPFVGESAVSIAIQHISAIPLMPRDIYPDIPVGLEDITMHAMEPDLSCRFTTAEEMLNDLEEFRKNPSISFNYVSSDTKNRQPVETINEQDTKVIQPTALIKAERPEPKPVKRKPAPKRVGMSSDEYRTVNKRATSTSTLIGVFFIIIFLVVILVFMWNYLLKDIFSPQEREQIEIPRFVGRIYEDVIKDELYSELYAFRPPRFEYSTLPRGMVISQSPDAGIMVDAPIGSNKRSIELVVSQGEQPSIVMPDLRNMHLITAQNQLKNLNLDLVVIEVPVLSEVADNLVTSTEPPANTELSRGDIITIRYNGGPERIQREVPDLVGRTKAQVESAFRSQEMTPRFEYFDDELPKDTVLFIEKAGQMVTVPITLVVHLSNGPPEPTETPSPSPEDTDEPPPTDPVVTETPSPSPSPSPEETDEPPPTDPVATESPSPSPSENPDEPPSGPGLEELPPEQPGEQPGIDESGSDRQQPDP